MGGPEANVPEVDTGIELARARELIVRQNELPSDFHPHKQIERLLQKRTAMGKGEQPLDWGTAELLAFASLVTEGSRVRFTGQDSPRGNLQQRHAVLPRRRGRPTHTCRSAIWLQTRRRSRFTTPRSAKPA